MRDWQNDVKLFHEKFGAVVGNINAPVAKEVVELRKRLIEEEHTELQNAIDVNNYDYIAKESADLIYVILGTMVSYGIDINPVWDAVQASNMAKVGGAKRPDGKVLKPAGWKAPDITKILDKQSLRDGEKLFEALNALP